MLKVPNLIKSKSKRRTRKDDAASIVGEKLADELERKSKAIDARSRFALVEMSDTLPYGGAVSLHDAQKYLKRSASRHRVEDAASIFVAIVQNVLERDDVTDKQAALEQAVDDFRQAISAETMLAVLQKSGVQVGKSVRELVRQHLYPQGFTAKAAVSRSLGIQPKQTAPQIGIKQIVRDSVGLREVDQRKALAAQVTGILRKSMGLDEIEYNPHSTKNIVRESVGLPHVMGVPDKPMSIKDTVNKSVGLPPAKPAKKPMSTREVVKRSLGLQ